MKKLVAILFGSGVVGVGLALVIGHAVGQAPPDLASTASAGLTKSTSSIDQPPSDPPPGGDFAIRSRRGRPGAMAKTPSVEDPASAIQRWKTTYHGTVFYETATERDATTPVRAAIAAAFKNLDPKSPERMEHYAWANDVPPFHAIGWNASISRLEPFEGGWQVEIHVSPMFDHSITLTDWCVERWIFQEGTLEQVPFPHAHRGTGRDVMITD